MLRLVPILLLVSCTVSLHLNQYNLSSELQKVTSQQQQFESQFLALSQ